ncbi:hypothetical protein [Alphaproteobacteria bacterium endosymbiont of Tiliacea citrago]|uniref:hypothetical protein n=1 Tax=Alphaproteobacteria bacterium endosymbiont of Tiliacea citrago TaxID=3077944 RepID=UPI00313A8060
MKNMKFVFLFLCFFCFAGLEEELRALQKNVLKFQSEHSNLLAPTKEEPVWYDVPKDIADTVKYKEAAFSAQKQRGDEPCILSVSPPRYIAVGKDGRVRDLTLDEKEGLQFRMDISKIRGVK